MAYSSMSPNAAALLDDAGFQHLPESWSVTTLGTLLAQDRGISVGVMYPGNHDPAGVPLIKAADLVGNVIRPEPEFRISRAKHDEYRRTELMGGELLISLVGEIGRCAVVSPAMRGWNAARAIAVLRFADAHDADFVRICLLSPPLQHLMQAWATTTVQATLNLKEIRQLPLPWPSRGEREAIVETLGALDAKIGLNCRMNHNLESIARAVFKSWFVDFDPVRKKTEGEEVGQPADLAALFPGDLVASAAGPIPRGWKVKPLDEVADFLNGLALQKYPPSGPDDLPVIKGAELTRGVTAATSKASRTVPPEYIVRDGDLLFSWSGSLHCVIWSGGEGALNQHLFKVTSADYPKWFVYQWLHEHLEGFRQIAADKATTMGHIKRGHLSEAMTVIPTSRVLVAANAVLSPIHARQLATDIESHRLIEARDALLPRLVGGWELVQAD